MLKDAQAIYLATVTGPCPVCGGHIIRIVFFPKGSEYISVVCRMCGIPTLVVRRSLLPKEAGEVVAEILEQWNSERADWGRYYNNSFYELDGWYFPWREHAAQPKPKPEKVLVTPVFTQDLAFW